MKVAILTTDNREHLHQYGESRPRFGTAPEALLQGFTGTSNIEIHVLSCTKKPMNSPTKLAENIWFHSLVVPQIGWLRTLYQGCIRAVRHRLTEICPDIVHGHGTERDCAISAVLSGYPNVITIHGNMRLIAKLNRPMMFSYLWMSAYLERFTIPRSGGVVCISKYTQAAVNHLARRTWVLPNAVDEEFFDALHAFPSERVLLCVGNVSLRKNQNMLIRALDSIADQFQFKVVFIGPTSPSDPYAAEFFHLIRSRIWCEHIPYANRDTLRKWLAWTQAVIVPSLEENCPMVVLEAMASGVPLLAANVGGIPELIDGKTNGMLFDPTDRENMKTVITTALKSPDLLQGMATAARQRALELYHPSVIARKHVALYRELLSPD